MLNASFRADLTGLQRAIIDLGTKQAPFACALAATRLAQGVMAQESAAIVETFDRPTPFSQRAFYMQSATKAKPVAYVSAKDIQAQYLAPYVYGGPRALGTKKAMLVPKQVGVNQFGNLPRNKLKSLKGRKDVFIGTVKFRKSGRTVSGVWQRPVAGQRRDLSRGTKGRTVDKLGGVRTGLKLLIEFEDTTEVTKHLPFYERAQDYVSRNASREFDLALRQALATRRK